MVTGTSFIPSRGRYVRTPAIASENGVEYVPPPVTDVQLITYAAIGVAAVAAGLYFRSTRENCECSSRTGRARDALAKAFKWFED